MMEKKPKKRTAKRKKTGSVWVPRPELVKMAQFLINPDDRRSKAEKIKAAGLSETIFYRWMKDARYIQYLNDQIDKYTDSELSEVWKALLRQCKLGNIAAIKLFFDMKRMNPELNDKRELERARLEIERQKLAILEAKAGGAGEELPDDGFLEALGAKVPDIWGGEEPCP
ncbi:phBC6A51 family helix-turn-helix protein [Sporomusa sp. KB1]|uniref:phBC6A51 family helix-turn-helix protein n=1 Tax=Sporomusa sp. KB1 TaxID=943346 RepID=UPI0016461C72|nr:phBC6A51 family helix-turn-helix protein [Sporomusa sp. KB1]